MSSQQKQIACENLEVSDDQENSFDDSKEEEKTSILTTTPGNLSWNQKLASNKKNNKQRTDRCQVAIASNRKMRVQTSSSTRKLSTSSISEGEISEFESFDVSTHHESEKQKLKERKRYSPQVNKLKTPFCKR